MPARPNCMVPNAQVVLALVLVELVVVPILLILALVLLALDATTTCHRHSDQRMSHHPYFKSIINYIQCIYIQRERENVQIEITSYLQYMIICNMYNILYTYIIYIYVHDIIHISPYQNKWLSLKDSSIWILQKHSRDVETSQHPTVVQVSWRISAWCPAMFDCVPLIRQTSPVRRVAVLGDSVICWPIWK